MTINYQWSVGRWDKTGMAVSWLILISRLGKKEKRPQGFPYFYEKVICSFNHFTSYLWVKIWKSSLQFWISTNKEANRAFEKINIEAKFFQFAIENDIKVAYVKVQHEILLKILGERFTDKKFLRVIERGLECGFML